MPSRYGQAMPGRLSDHWFPILMGTLALTTAVAGLVGRSATGAGFWIANFVASLSIAAAAVVPIVRNSRRENAETQAGELAVQARAEMRVAMNDALGPLTSALARLTAAPTSKRKALLERVLMLGVTVTAGLVDAERARSTLYRLDPRSDHWRLVPETSAGRTDQARTVFVEGTDAGEAVRKMIEGDAFIYCRDVLEEPPPGWVPDPTRTYKTFISVAVRAGDRAFGMLTVNALEPDDLSDDDVSTMRVISAVLAAALALVEPRRSDVGGR